MRRIAIGVRIVLRALLVVVATAPVGILETALDVAMRLLADAARRILMLRFDALVAFVRQRGRIVLPRAGAALIKSGERA